jgi:hypothetical protein
VAKIANDDAAGKDDAGVRLRKPLRRVRLEHIEPGAAPDSTFRSYPSAASDSNSSRALSDSHTDSDSVEEENHPHHDELSVRSRTDRLDRLDAPDALGALDAPDALGGGGGSVRVERSVEVALYEAASDIAAVLKKRTGHLTVAQREENLGFYRLMVARALRGVPGADEEFASDHECIRQGIEYIADELEVAADTLMLAVENVWDEVQRPGTALSRALQRADQAPVTLGGPFARRQARFRRFFGMAYWCQREEPDRAMPLPVEAIAKLLGLGDSGWATVREYREALVKAGVLKPESALFTYKAGKRTAKTYWFNFASPHYTPPEVGE